jgi:hypothetical protein
MCSFDIWVKTTLGLVAAAAWWPLAMAAGSDGPIPLTDRPLLFVDDSGVAVRRTVVRTFHPATRREQPVITADRSWENQRVYMWGSVHHDPVARTFTMWYLGRVPETSRTALQYATSADGLNWTKPALGLHAVQGSSANNVFDGGGGSSASVLVDAFARDPAERFKMLVYRRGGYRAAQSRDGIRWTEVSPEPAFGGGDTVMLAQNPATGEYLAYHKRPATIRGFPRRVVWLARSRDFRHWSEAELVFAPDEADDDWPRRPSDRTEVYVMSVVAHAAGYMGFPAIFRHTPQELDGSPTAGGGMLSREAGAVTGTGPLDIQLATSPDGVAWSRTWPRLAVIPRGPPGSYDGGAILNTASAPVDVGDQTWLYYTAISTGHGAPVPPKAISIGRADWRLHGYASLDAGPEGGEVRTKSITLGRSRLVVNADASRGELRVALLEADGRPIDGYALEQSEVLSSDATQWTARWRGRDAAPVDRPVQVLIAMYNARLYSLSSGR